MATRRSKALGAAAIGVVTCCALAAAEGCSSKSSGGGGGTADSGTPARDGSTDSTTSDAPGATDSPAATDAPVEGGATVDAPTDSPASADGGLPDGYVGYVGNIPVSDQVTALGVNVTTDTVYAALADLNGRSAGIAVIDDATGALTATIAPLMVDGGPVPPYFDQPLMAVDSTSNVVYGVRQFGHVIDVFDGATNAYTGSIDVDALDTAAGPQLNWLAVDGTRSMLYASSGKNSNVVISIIGTAGGTYSLASSIALSDLQSTVGALALDTTNQLLFVANSSPYFHQTPAPPLLVDEIDTATNQVAAGKQQSLGPGTSVSVLGGAGAATLVADVPVADGGQDAGDSGGTFFSLEPGSVSFNGYTPDYHTQCWLSPTRYVVWVHSGTLTQVASVEIDPTEQQPPKVTALSGFFTPGTVDVTGFVCGKNHCYSNGYEEGSGGSGPYSWVVNLLDACP